MAVALNADETLLTCVTHDKQLAVYKIGHSPFRGSIISSREIPRNATSMVTTKYDQDGAHHEAILVAVNAGELGK